MRACPAPARQAPTAAAADRAGPPINPSCIGMLKIGECHSAMRIDVVDPSAYAPHYDHGLCRALARAGADVRLVTSDFRYGPVPQADGYDVERLFYRRAANSRRRRLRRVAKLAQHPADMARYQRLARAADVVHFQWFAVEPLDVALRPRGRPTVITPAGASAALGRRGPAELVPLEDPAARGGASVRLIEAEDPRARLAAG